MHELSIALSIVELAERHARGHNSANIEEVELDIGALAGVDIPTLEFALVSAVKGTLLEHAKIVRNHIGGEGLCEQCGLLMPLEAPWRACPECGSYQVKITKGRELRVKAIVIGNS